MPIADLSPGYVHEDGRLDLESVWNPTVDVPMLAVGFVQAFLGPLSHLDASESEVEYTWITTDQVSDGATFGSGDCHLYAINAKGGRFAILRDTSPDADLSDPTTFADGELILEAYFRDYYPGVLPGQVDDLLAAVRTVTPDAIRDVVREFEGIGCDEFIFVPIKPDLSHLDGLAEIVC